MPKQTLSVNIPIDKPDAFLQLCEAVSSKHNSDPVASPLDPAMMASFDSLLLAAQASRHTARQQHSRGQQQLESSRIAMGFARHQNAQSPDTLNNILLQVRDLLNILNRQNPEATSQWGFDVVVGSTNGRVTVRYNIPTNHDKYLDLADAIWAKHLADGPSSPLASLNMTAFDLLRQQARTEREAGKTAHALAKTENGAANRRIGRAKHQNSRSPDTLYYHLIGIRDILKIHNQENPQALGLWGFNAVVGSAAVGRKPKPKTNIAKKTNQTNRLAYRKTNVPERSILIGVVGTGIGTKQPRARPAQGVENRPRQPIWVD